MYMQTHKTVEVSEDFLIAVECKNTDVKLLEASANLDLTEFNLNEAELDKLRQILKRLNFEIMNALQKCSPAVSLIAEIKVRDKSDF